MYIILQVLFIFSSFEIGWCHWSLKWGNHTLYNSKLKEPKPTKICCPGLDCVSTDPPFSHLPLPECPLKLNIKYQMYTLDRGIPWAMQLNHNGSLGIPKYIEELLVKKRTVFVIHGYMNSKESEYLHQIKDALLEQDDVNVVLVGWKDMANRILYPLSASMTRIVGAETAFMIDRLKTEKGLTSDKIWCIGFSLGAHACGFTGQFTHMKRILGLDPAGPYFAGYSPDARLSSDDADVVEAIHTDGYGWFSFFGTLQPFGDIDFYPNGGSNQPGCWTSLPDDLDDPLDMQDSDFRKRTDDEDYYDNYDDKPTSFKAPVPSLEDTAVCSHKRAVIYFLSSLRNPHCFITESKCTDEKKIPSSCKLDCSSDIWCPEMSYHANNSGFQGIYYVQTSSKAPHCLV